VDVVWWCPEPDDNGVDVFLDFPRFEVCLNCLCVCWFLVLDVECRRWNVMFLCSGVLGALYLREADLFVLAAPLFKDSVSSRRQWPCYSSRGGLEREGYGALSSNIVCACIAILGATLHLSSRIFMEKLKDVAGKN